MDNQDPLPQTATHHSAPAADLEIRVTLVQGEGRGVLEYTLHSHESNVGFHHKKIQGKALLGSPEEFQKHLLVRMEKLHAGLGPSNEKLYLEEIEQELASLGRWLYNELFSQDLCTAYRRFRGVVETLLITSDEPWIPWELIKPYDASDADEIIDDDFLCIRFQLTRWLAGDKSPASKLPVTRLAAIDCGRQAGTKPLPHAAEERKLLLQMAEENAHIDDASIEGATWAQLRQLLEEVDLLHFIGHGNFLPDRPHESPIELADRPFRPHDLTGPLQTRVRRNRPLVFLNACRIAQQGWTLTNLGGWARTWVRDCHSGAFVAPQWTVPDDLAYAFAKEFYGALRGGKTVGEASRDARRKLKEDHPGRPTWLAYSVYAHPNAHLLPGPEALQVRPPAPQFVSSWASAPPEIRKHILDQKWLIEDKTRSFVGRQWIFERIHRFIESEPRGYFVLRGDPGIGKSALMAELVRRKGYLHHFNVRASGYNRAETFLANICAQLIAAHGLSYTFLPPEATGDARFLNGLLEQAAMKRQARGQKVVLLVDALDEVDRTSQPAGVNPLFLPPRLPDGVYVIATARHGEPHLRIDCEQEPFKLEQGATDNLADIQIFVESKLELPGIRRYLERQDLDKEDFVVELVAKSQGNFMYLEHVLPAIAEGLYRDRDFTTLPDGLENYYEDNWQLIRRQDEDAWFDYKLPVLVALTVVREPVTIHLLQRFSGVERRPRIYQVLEEWAQFLYVAVMAEGDDHAQKRYRIYHASFQEFVADKDEVADERVNLKLTHARIADALIEEIYGLDEQ